MTPTLCPPNNCLLHLHLPNKNFHLTLSEIPLLRLSLYFRHAFSHEQILIRGVSLIIYRRLWACYDSHTGVLHLDWIVIYKGKSVYEVPCFGDANISWISAAVLLLILMSADEMMD